MSSFQSIVALFYVIFFILSACSLTFAAPIDIKGVTSSVTKHNSCYNYIMTALVVLADMDDIDGGPKKTRVKRNGAGKFAEAASMTPMKVLQLMLALVKNVFAEEPIGGRHPMSRSVPGPVVYLFKQSIVQKLFPDLSKDH